MKTKKLLALLLSFAMVFGAVGCGANKTDDAESTPENVGTETSEDATEEGGTLSLFVQAADDVRIAIKDDYIVPNFAEAFPGWELEVTVIGTDASTVAAMKTYNSTGDLPDVYWSDPTWCIPMINSGNQLDLKSYITSDGFDAYYNGDISLMEYKDGVYALQPGSDSRYFPVFYYNTEIFAENNLEVPTTLDELFDVCDKLVAAGVQPFSIDGAGGYFSMDWFQLLLEMIDASKVDAMLKNEIDFTDPAVLEVFETLETMLEKGYFGDRLTAAARTPAEAREQLASGQVAMFADFYWQHSMYCDKGMDFFLLKSSTGEDVIQRWGNSFSGYAVYSGSKHVDMAVKLAEYCCEQEAKYHNEHGTATAFDTGITVEASNDLQQKLNDCYESTTNKKNGIYNNNFDSYVLGEFKTLLSSFTAGQITAQELVDEFQPIYEQNTMFE